MSPTVTKSQIQSSMHYLNITDGYYEACTSNPNVEYSAASDRSSLEFIWELASVNAFSCYWREWEPSGSNAVADHLKALIACACLFFLFDASCSVPRLSSARGCCLLLFPCCLCGSARSCLMSLDHEHYRSYFSCTFHNFLSTVGIEGCVVSQSFSLTQLSYSFWFERPLFYRLCYRIVIVYCLFYRCWFFLLLWSCEACTYKHLLGSNYQIQTACSNQMKQRIN